MVELLEKLQEIPEILLGDSADFLQSDNEYEKILQAGSTSSFNLQQNVHISPLPKDFSSNFVTQHTLRPVRELHGLDLPEIIFDPISYEDLILNTAVDEGSLTTMSDETKDKVQCEYYYEKQLWESAGNEIENEEKKSQIKLQDYYYQRQKRSSYGCTKRSSLRKWVACKKKFSTKYNATEDR